MSTTLDLSVETGVEVEVNNGAVLLRSDDTPLVLSAHDCIELSRALVRAACEALGVK